MTGGSRPERRGGRLRRLLGRPEAAEQGDEGTGPEPAAAVCSPIRECLNVTDRRPVVRVSGTLRSVNARTVAGLPALEAELDDGSGSLDVVWLGRQAIPGIEPGRELTASGRIATTRGRPVLFNPRYELRPLETE